jgi:hypothetical protein
VPWDGVSSDDIEVQVRSGTRVPDLDVDENEPVLVTINDVINAALHATPAARPTALDINNAFAELIRSLIAAASQ